MKILIVYSIDNIGYIETDKTQSFTGITPFKIGTGTNYYFFHFVFKIKYN
jgi:hypothetical protein